MGFRCLLPMLSLALLLGCSTTSEDPAPPAKSWKVVSQGQCASATAPQTILVDNQTQWTTVWSKVSTQPAPAIDFTKQQVAGIFLGTQGNPCFSAAVVGVTEKATEVVIGYKLQDPPAGTSCIHSYGYPYVLASLTRTSKPVRFSDETPRPWRVIGQGDAIAPQVPENVVIRDQAALAAQWAKVSPTAAPIVDFSQDMVAAILLGAGSACDDLEVISYELDQTGRVLAYEVKGPAPGTACIHSIVYPYLFVTLPKTALALRFSNRTAGAWKVLGSGTALGALNPQNVVIEDQAAYAALWATASDAPAPAVDFTKERVAAVLLGSHPSPCYAVSVISRTESEGGIVLGYRDQEPRMDAVCAAVIAYPFTFVSLPVSSKPIAFVLEP